MSQRDRIRSLLEVYSICALVISFCIVISGHFLKPSTKMNVLAVVISKIFAIGMCGKYERIKFPSTHSLSLTNDISIHLSNILKNIRHADIPHSYITWHIIHLLTGVSWLLFLWVKKIKGITITEWCFTEDCVS